MRLIDEATYALRMRNSTLNLDATKWSPETEYGEFIHRIDTIIHDYDDNMMSLDVTNKHNITLVHCQNKFGKMERVSIELPGKSTFTGKSTSVEGYRIEGMDRNLLKYVMAIEDNINPLGGKLTNFLFSQNELEYFLKAGFFPMLMKEVTTEVLDDLIRKIPGTEAIAGVDEMMHALNRFSIIDDNPARDKITQLCQEHRFDGFDTIEGQEEEIFRSNRRVKNHCAMPLVHHGMLIYMMLTLYFCSDVLATSESEEKKPSFTSLIWLFYTFIVGFFMNRVQKMISLAIALLLVFVTKYYGVENSVSNVLACQFVPMVNSTVEYNEKVRYSAVVWTGLKFANQFCASNIRSNETVFNINGWRNNYKLGNCYKSDDPLEIKVGENLLGQSFLEDATYCYCGSALREQPKKIDTDCTGFQIWVDATHDSKKCPFIPTGHYSWYVKELCFSGYNRFTICEITEIGDFKIQGNIIDTKANGTIATGWASDSVTGRQEGVGSGLSWFVTRDTQFLGKMVIMDTKDNALYITDKASVNTIDTYDVRKPGWFRRDNKDAEDLVAEQLAIEIQDCEKNIIQMKTKMALFENTFSKTQVDKRIRNMGPEVWVDGKLLHIEGDSDIGFNGWSKLKWGMMIYDEGTPRRVGIDINMNCPDADKTDTRTITGAGDPDEGMVLTNCVWYNVRDYGGELCTILIEFNQNSNNLRMSAYIRDSTNAIKNAEFQLWPSRDIYKYQGLYEDLSEGHSVGFPLISKRTVTIDYNEITFTSDDSAVQLSFMTEESIIQVPFKKPTITKVEITCLFGNCTLEVVSDMFPIAAQFDVCVDDALVRSRFTQLYSSESCNSTVRLILSSNDENIKTSYHSVSSLKRIGIEFRKFTQETPGWDLGSWFDWNMIKHWLSYGLGAYTIYIIIVAIVVIAILFIWFVLPYILTAYRAYKVKKTLSGNGPIKITKKNPYELERELREKMKYL